MVRCEKKYIKKQILGSEQLCKGVNSIRKSTDKSKNLLKIRRTFIIVQVGFWPDFETLFHYIIEI
jgi:hypothetical protein